MAQFVQQVSKSVEIYLDFIIIISIQNKILPSYNETFVSPFSPLAFFSLFTACNAHIFSLFTFTPAHSPHCNAYIFPSSF